MLELVGGLAILLISLGISWLFGSFVFWFVMRTMTDETDASLGKCFLATLSIFIAGAVSLLTLLIPVIGIVLFFVAWFKLSSILVEAIFEMREGGGTVVFLYMLTIIAVNMLAARFGA